MKTLSTLSLLLIFSVGCATQTPVGRDIASKKEPYDVSTYYDIDLYKANLNVAKAQSFDDHLSDLDYIVVSPVEINKKEVIPEAAPFVCSSLGYTYMAGASLKECTQPGADLMSATTIQYFAGDKRQVGVGTAVSFIPVDKCYSPSSNGFSQKPRLAVLKAVRCGKDRK